MMINGLNVAKVYSGKPGCMCGCKGKWSHASDAKELQEYNDVSDRSVKIIANKLFKFPKEMVKVDEYGDTNVYYVETPERIWAVYTQ